MTKQAEEAVKNMVKKALDISDIENEIGTYIDDSYEDKVRSKIDYQKSKRFPLRHPVLTGISTLGIAPAAAKQQATDEIVRDMARKYPEIRDKALKTQREKDRRAHELLKARARANKVRFG